MTDSILGTKRKKKTLISVPHLMKSQVIPCLLYGFVFANALGWITNQANVATDPHGPCSFCKVLLN